VAVETFALERDEQHARHDGARIAADAGEFDVAAMRMAVDQGGGGGERQHRRSPV